MSKSINFLQKKALIPNNSVDDLKANRHGLSSNLIHAHLNMPYQDAKCLK